MIRHRESLAMLAALPMQPSLAIAQGDERASALLRECLAVQPAPGYVTLQVDAEPPRFAAAMRKCSPRWPAATR